MKLICTQENFKKAIFNTERVTGKQINLPILSNILLETEKGRLKFSATNLEIGVITRIGAKIEREGKIAIPAKLLSSFVFNLPSEEQITLEVVDMNLKITSGSYKAQIKGLEAQDFPIIPKKTTEYLFNLSAQKIKEAVSRVLICISLNETRPELAGVNVILTPEAISFAATDSFRLGEEVVKLENKDKSENYTRFIEKNHSLIVPASTFTEVLRVITPEIEKITVVIEENQIFFEVDGVLIVSRLINGKYPEYKQIIPQKFNTRAVLGKEEFTRALRIAGVFTNNKTGEVGVKIDAARKVIIITSQAQETGENTTELKADISGPEQEIIFNPRYMLDGVNSIATTKVAFLSNNNVSPAALRDIDEKNGEVLMEYTYIVMPVKN